MCILRAIWPHWFAYYYYIIINYYNIITHIIYGPATVERNRTVFVTVLYNIKKNVLIYILYKRNPEKNLIVKFNTTIEFEKVKPLKRFYFYHRMNHIITRIMCTQCYGSDSTRHFPKWGGWGPIINTLARWYYCYDLHKYRKKIISIDTMIICQGCKVLTQNSLFPPTMEALLE